MKRLCALPLLGLALLVYGCGSRDNPIEPEFRGNPLPTGPNGVVTGVISAAGGPWLVTDTLRVPAGQSLVIEPGAELRFDLLRDDGHERALPFIVEGKITAVGTEQMPIIFTSARRFPDRGDWDGVWLVSADPTSRFEYCRFQFGAKYGRRYHYRTVGGQLDSTLFEYGQLTLFNSSPTVKRCWFLAGGFHGVHADSLARPTIENCNFYDNAGHGIYVHPDADPVVRYNIIVENDDYGVFFRMEGEAGLRRPDALLSHNIVWSNFSGEFNQNAPQGLGRASQMNENLDSCDFRFNLRLDPYFQDATQWDFRLNPCSAAIDAGPADDDARDPDGTRMELGIYRYVYRPGELRRRIDVARLEAARSPYFMSCDAILPQGGTLTIEPGVEVRVEGRFAFTVRGRLLSQGSAEAPVKFLSAAAQPAKGYWIGLLFPSDAEPGTVLSYTQISHARWGVALKQMDITLDHCSIFENDSVGVLCDDHSSPLITDCIIRNNAVAGVLAQFNSAPVIRRTWFIGGAGYGVYARESSRPDIAASIFVGAAVNGIRLENLSNAVIVNNTIVQNGYYGLFCFNNSSPDVRNNIFYGNGDALRGGYGLMAERTSLPTIEFNGFWANPRGEALIAGNPDWFDAARNILADPLFSPDGEEFRLAAGSPYRDAGDPAINDPDGSRSDLGAYGGPWAMR